MNMNDTLVGLLEETDKGFPATVTVLCEIHFLSCQPFFCGHFFFAGILSCQPIVNWSNEGFVSCEKKINEA